MDLNEIEFWKLRITAKRNSLVAEHTELLRIEPNDMKEDILKDEKLFLLSKRIKSLESFYKKFVS